MSILNSYDPNPVAILNPQHLAPPIYGFPEVAVATFKREILRRALVKYDPVPMEVIHAGFHMPIYRLTYQNRELALYESLVGAAVAAGMLEELISKGAKKVVFFGSCGVLDKTLEAGRLIVPTAACRDEGTSYHYLPPADYVEVPTAARLANILTEMNLPFVTGKTWSTDAIYRETRSNMAKRRAEGCVAVEMECAALAAVGLFRGVEVYQYLFAEDNLDAENWDQRTMGRVPRSANERYLRLALEIALRV
ncbi:MAG: nucleoside phosphorylase [Oscillospiraceae bacterium]|jgi:uridine phosphorylase|nr:nucleoside phosphorylase [Oscillospiraceae bacterium]